MTPINMDADVLIIGSGAGGSSVADVVTRSGRSVIMMEEGGAYVPDPSASTAEAIQTTWRGGGLTAALGTTPIAYAEGRVLGGGTEINSAIVQRTDPALLDAWAARYKIAEFSGQKMEPYFDWAERTVNASYTEGDAGPPTNILRRGGQAMGWRVTDLKRGQRDCHGANRCSLVCPNQAKQSMSVTLLPTARARGMVVLPNTRATKLEVQGSQISVVHALRRLEGGATENIAIRAKQVFCCAGAIHTPLLLRRSGIRHYVGQSLRLHPTIKATAIFPQTIDAHKYRLPLVAITEFMPNQRFGGAVFTPAIFGLSLAEDWVMRSDLMPQWRHAASYYAMIKPKGIGSVMPVPFADEPIVRFSLMPEDWVALGQGVSRLAQALFAAGATKVMPSITGHRGWSCAGDATEYMEQPLPKKKTNLMTIHLFSSCPPGENAELCATDSFGKVYGLNNLYVADASAIPEAPGVNPQMTIMALARRVAEAACLS